MEKSTGKKRAKKSSLRIALYSLIALALVLGGSLFFLRYYDQYKETLRQNIISSGVFHKGIEVDGIAIGGMTFEEAKVALTVREAELVQNVGFTFSCDDTVYTADQSFFIINYTTDEVLSEAMALAREGDLKQLREETEDISTNGRYYRITCTVEPDQPKFEAFFSTMATERDIAPVDAFFAVKELPYDETTDGPAAFDIGLPEDGSITDLRDLRFDFTESVNGYGVDYEALLKLVVNNTASAKFGEILVPLSEVEAEVTVETIKQQLVLRASSKTSYGTTSLSKPGRLQNMKKASGKVYGTILHPGDEFSTNGTLGDRTLKGGWALAPAIIDGGADTEDQPGGGVCQISTTLYGAVLSSDMRIVARRGHSSKSAYVDGGMDATIADSTTGNIDFKWANNTESDVYVFVWLDTKTKEVFCEIYGEPLPETFDRIVLKSELTETIQPTADVFIESSSLAAPYWQLKNAAKKGYRYKTYKVYMLGEEVVETVLVDETTYNMHPNRYNVWAGFRQLPQPLLSQYQLPLPKKN